MYTAHDGHNFKPGRTAAPQNPAVYTRIPATLGRNGRKNWNKENQNAQGLSRRTINRKKKGQRSIRLNKAYRAIYQETTDGLELLIIEVHKHEY